MKKILHLLLCIVVSMNTVVAQDFGKEIKIDLSVLDQKLQKANAVNEADLPLIDFSMPDGTVLNFRVKSSAVFTDQPKDTKTYGGQTDDDKSKIRFSVTPSGGFTAIIHHNNQYYFIEPIDKKAGTYRIYNMNESPRGNCGNDGEAKAFGSLPVKNGRILSVAPFPVGSQLRTYRMAAAATGEMVIAYGGQSQARDQIVAITNAMNLIYELEASIRFSLISKTTTSPFPLMFSAPATDPFTIDLAFASASNSQTGFNTLNTNAALLYNEYDVAHTFNSYISSNSATWGGGMSSPTYFVQGQAGGQPCNNSNKATGWTEFVSGANLATIVGLTAHEVAHQFSVGHTYNAVGGSMSSPTFCTGGWSSQSAVEPGSGSTLMGYGGNCSFPNNYVLAAPNSEGYFHTRSLEQMFNAVNNTSTCFTTSATGNTPPNSDAGLDYTIPKGTPFTLTGTATDPNMADVLSYAWDQFDVASANDRGAFGAAVTGTGGYTAVNSPASAPLFRSRILNVPSRTFPSLSFILNNANNPAANQGEALPQVARQMKFRLTVRDNRTNGGGVDSDETTITVADRGPFLITSQNTATNWFANGTNTATVVWSVNGTHLSPVLCNNVKISFSTDGGTTFPIVLAASTPNDGSHVITIPNNATTTGRIKVEAVGNIFFDINHAAITISTTCSTVASTLSPATAVSAQAGSPSLNLTLTPASSSTYRFVIVNTTTGNITAIQDTPNLTNAAIFVPGSYAIRGFSSSGINLTSYIGTSFATFQGLLSATVCGQLSSNSVAVTVQSCATTAPTLSAAASVCMGDATTLTATGCAGTVNWTAIPSWSPVPSGASGPVIPTQTTTYYATCTNGGCASLANLVLITVNPVPTPPSATTGATVARGNTASLTASGCASGTINWFSSEVSSTVVGTGSPFVTPSLANSVTYFAACFNGNCNSARVAATANVSNPCLTSASTIQPIAPVTAAAGNAALNLGLIGIGNTISSFSGTIATTDPATGLTLNSSGCAYFGGNATYYDSYPIVVSANGSYTFTRTGSSSTVMQLYDGSFTAGNSCGTWVGGTVNGGSNFTVTLTANKRYIFVVTGFGPSDPYPLSYTVSFTPPSGATVNAPLPVTGSAYGYTYVVTENTSGAIVGFSATSNLTSAATYGAGAYTVRGLSFETSTVTNLSSYVNTLYSAFQTQLPLPNCAALSSNSKPVTVTGCPSAPIVLPVTINAGNTATLTALNCAGTVNWHDMASGGTLLGSGTPFTTGTLAANTTFHASCSAMSCPVSSRSSVLVTVNPCPSLSILSGTAITGTTSKASSGIESTQLINVGTTVTYQTGNYTLLKPGFEIKAGAVFKTQYGGCL
ncbi:MAG: hypothetical protein EAZ32_14765 [Cytophagia bacterium]|nr:MAG: hypothetical protein EAZ38_15845 [Cytophagales bacterium]TAG37639.1 MAG: hypothetical protein EAZ32_14765 [Cytophagia bacterium]TAG78775.1 MAG: hypothetical protein EAZ22_12910 [Cytophagales bacterium]